MAAKGPTSTIGRTPPEDRGANESADSIVPTPRSNGSGAPASTSTHTRVPTPDAPARFAPLISAVAEWQLLQTTRIKVELPAKAVIRQGGDLPVWLVETLARLTVEERGAEKRILTAWKTHPLAAWATNVRGLGDHSTAIIVGLLEGDPYTAYPRRRVGARGASKFVWEDPYTRTLGQLKAYCGYGNPDRRREQGMGQDELLALGKPILKARLRLAAEAVMKASNEDYRALYDQAREAVSERTHDRSCPPCHAKAGDPWKPGHQHAHALRVIVKKGILPDLYAEAKRLHEAGAW